VTPANNIQLSQNQKSSTSGDEEMLQLVDAPGLFEFN
jgi:hypothetical protein